MTLLLNRATLRVYGGKTAYKQLGPNYWAYLNRMQMAKQLGRLAGVKVDIRRVEKQLRFLENRNAIRIVGSQIHYNPLAVDLGDEGSGVVDVASTIANIISSDCKLPPDLLVENEELADLKIGITTKDKLKTFFFNPVLRLRAKDKVAERMLVKLNERGTKAERARLAAKGKKVAECIAVVEKEMRRVRSQAIEEIRDYFDPSTGRSYQQVVSPAGSFEINPKHRRTKKKFSFVISDLHLNTEPHPKKDDLLRLFMLAQNLRAGMVLNGDIYDFFVWKSTLMRIRAANPHIMNAIDRTPEVLQLIGNHDAKFREIAPYGKFGLNVHVQETYYGSHVYFEHGHQSDRYNQEDRKIGLYIVKFGTWLMGRTLMKKLFPNFIEWMEILGRLWFSQEKWKAHKVDSLVERIRSVVRKLEAGQEEPFTADNPLIYVRGHDHGAGYWFTNQDIIKAINDDPELAGKVRYCTTGSWKGDEAYLLALDFSHPDRVYPYPFIWKPTYDQFVAFK